MPPSVVLRRRRSARSDADDSRPAPHARSNGFGDAVGVAANAVDHRRGHRIEEVQSDEVQAGLTIHRASRLPRLAIAVEDWQVDPREAGMEAGTPDDVGDVQRAAVLGSWHTVLDAC